MSTTKHPRHAFTGQLFTSDGLSVKVSISHTDEGIFVTVLERAAELFDRPLTDLTLESTGGRGVLRTRGTAQRIDFHLIQFFLDDTADVLQRRQFVRVTAAQPVVLMDAEEGDKLADGMAVNISGGGLLITLPPNKTVDATIVQFHLYLREADEPVTGVGKVIRAGADDRLALAFEQISRRDRDRVIKFVFDRQRAAIAMTRGDVV
jgi:hypothetical protein